MRVHILSTKINLQLLYTTYGLIGIFAGTIPFFEKFLFLMMMSNYLNLFHLVPMGYCDVSWFPNSKIFKF